MPPPLFPLKRGVQALEISEPTPRRLVGESGLLIDHLIKGKQKAI